MTYDVQGYGPLIWLLVMLLAFTVTIIALLLDSPGDTSVDKPPLECDERLP